MQASRLVIAVVDDEEPVRRALGRLIQASGYDAVTFASGYEFLEFLSRVRPACALLDLHLPGLTGLDLLNNLSSMQPRVPSVVITGHDAPGVKARVLAAGASEYLLKPFDENVLLAAVAAASRS
ncbi:MAG TPA: response regulator [Steroidobacteraceae bacterium]|nr:response regulator [Steroidobacteraceae bacterium]